MPAPHVEANVGWPLYEKDPNSDVKVATLVNGEQ
jgi:hypothetical protein